MAHDRPAVRQPSAVHHPSTVDARHGSWRPPRWVWAILLLDLAAVAALRAVDPLGDRATLNVTTFVLVVLGALVLLAWFTFWSGHPWRTRLMPAAVLALAMAAFFGFLRLERWSGELVPSFVPRWAAKPDRQLAVPDQDSGPAAVDLATTTADDFPHFLGPERRNAVDHLELARDWASTPPEQVWRQEIGAGWSGFAVVNGFAVTMEQRGDLELVTCYDAATGELRWSHATPTRYELLVAGVGPRSTPAIAGGRVYALGATGRLVALEGATGALVWEHDLLAEYGMPAAQEAEELPYGRAASPLVVGDLVVVPVGGPSTGRRVSLVAFDRHTGARVWEGGDRQISCSSPTLATLGGREQILIVNESSVTGHDPADGRVLWEHPWEGRSNANASVSQPVPLPGDRVFLSKGYGVGAALLQLEPRADGTFAVAELWHEPRVLRTKFTNVAIYQDHVYGLSDGILEAVELDTGRRAWKGGRYHQGQILRVGVVLLVLAESGELFMVEATPERPNHVLGSFQAVAGKTWNNLALYGPYLLVRNASEAACYKLPLAG